MVNRKSATFTTMVEYRDRLSAAMKAASISATQLAEGLDTSYQAVKKVIDGKSSAFNAANNALAARILGVSSDWLALGDATMQRSDAAVSDAAPWPFSGVSESTIRGLPVDQVKQVEGAILLVLAQLGVKNKAAGRVSAPAAAPSRRTLVDLDNAPDEFGMRIDGLPPAPWEPGGVTTKQSERAAQGLRISQAVDVGHVADSGYSANDQEFLPVPELDVRLAAGTLGIENYHETEIGQILLRRSFLESFKLPIERMRIVYPDGDSMEPIIRHRNPMLMFIDPLDDLKCVNSRYVYAINRGGSMIVKCIAKDRDGTWLAKSLNPVYPPFPLQSEDGRDVRVVGRILWSPYDLRNGVDARLL